MKRNHNDEDKTNLGGVEELDKALKGEEEGITPPESEGQEPTDDLESHKTASSLDHPRGSINLKHFDKQTRDAVQRILESLAEGNAEDIALADAAGRYTATDVEAALAEIAGAGRAAETVVGNAADIAALTAIKSTSANYTVLDDDGYAVILVTVGSVSDKTITLPTLAGNQARPILIIKVDSGTKEGIVDGEGAETVEGFTTVRLVNQYDFIHIVGGPTTWLRRGGAIAPNAGEYAGGQWHPIKDPTVGSFGSKVAGWTADRFTQASGGWELDFSSDVPIGTKTVKVHLQAHSSGAHLIMARKEGDTNISNTPVASTEWSTIIATIPASGIYWGAQVTLWLSDDYKAEIAVSHADVDITLISYPRAYMR